MKSIKNWKMQKLLNEFNSSQIGGGEKINRISGSSGFLGNKAHSVSGSERSQIKQEIELIHKNNGENPIETLSDVMALTFSIVGGMGANVTSSEVKDFIQQFMTSQSSKSPV